tara:strand:- start:159 stop:473 length:315 start_codon:yes stop_codon:yes gene_type:complete
MGKKATKKRPATYIFASGKRINQGIIEALLQEARIDGKYGPYVVYGHYKNHTGQYDILAHRCDRHRASFLGSVNPDQAAKAIEKACELLSNGLKPFQVRAELNA